MPPLDGYLLVKWLHIVSSTVLFGTGLGTAFFFWSARKGDTSVQLFVARTTVRADFIFTLPAVILQPITGAIMIMRAGWNPADLWLIVSYCLYFLAGLCWLPVVVIQIRIKRLLESAATGGTFDQASFLKLRRAWFLLGWPAFSALLLVFLLMIAKPGW